MLVLGHEKEFKDGEESRLAFRKLFGKQASKEMQMYTLEN